MYDLAPAPPPPVTARAVAPRECLEYAPRPAWHTRPLLRRGLCAVAAVALALCWVRWGEPARQRTVLLYAQAECATYVAPAGQLVYDTTRRPRPDPALPWTGYTARVWAVPPVVVRPGSTAFLHGR